jgi:glutamate N-acetyltransferase/amino-acid N-acetyltransferase
VAVGVTYPRGFRAAGVGAGIKASGRPDVALVVSDGPADTAGVFTRSRAASPPVRRNRAALAATGGRARGVLVTSGNANAATGSQGEADARRMAELAAELVGASPDDLLVCSTGVIGVPLPMERVELGVRLAASALSADGGGAAAEAICTTDAGPKIASRTLVLQGREVRLGAIAKGAAMIRPDLGTMIAVVTTDAAIDPGLLRELLVDAAEASFNRITVDGSESTSDSLIVLAGGASGVAVGGAEARQFGDALDDVCRELALAMVRDGEGARRVGRYEVTGARTDDEARRAARRVAEDQLVRCALYGGDPNWGRIYAALGVAGVEVDLARLAIAIGDVPLMRDGSPLALDNGAASRAAAEDEVVYAIDLGCGPGSGTVWGSDLGHEYVRMNAEYTT